MDQSQFQAYEVAGATDMNRAHQFPQDYFKEVVEGMIGGGLSVSNALFGTTGFSSAIVAGPQLEITVNAQTFAAAGRIGSVSTDVSNHTSSAPANTQRFYIYLDIQTTEVTESRDIANPATGVKTPTMIVTHKTAAAGVVVIEVNDGDPEAPPAIGVISPGVERLGYIKLGYVDYNQNGTSNVDVPNTAGVFTSPGTPNLSLTSLDDIGDVVAPAPSTGDLLQNNGTNWVNVTVQDTIGDTLRQVNGFRLSTSLVTPIHPDSGSSTTIYATPFVSPHIALYDGTKYVLKSTAAVGLALAGLTVDLPYDVFAYLSGGAPALELLAWTNATTRATAVSWTGGVLTKSGDQTRRYLGTIVPSAANTVTISARRKPIWNLYNQVVVRAQISDTNLVPFINNDPNFRAYNNDTNNALQVMLGLDQNAISIRVGGTLSLNNDSGATSSSGRYGIGIDSTTIDSSVFASKPLAPPPSSLNGIQFSAIASYSGHLLGFRTFTLLEQGKFTGGSVQSIGAFGTPVGIIGEVLM